MLSFTFAMANCTDDLMLIITQTHPPPPLPTLLKTGYCTIKASCLAGHFPAYFVHIFAQTSDIFFSRLGHCSEYRALFFVKVPVHANACAGGFPVVLLLSCVLKMPHYPTSTLIKRWNKSILISCSFKSPSNRPLTGGLPAWEIYLINSDISIYDYELSWNCSKFCPPNLALKTVSLFVIRIFNQWCKLFKIRNTPRHRGLLQGEGLSTSTTCLLSNTGVWNTTGIVVTLLVNSALYPSLHSLAVSFSIC